MNLSDLSAAQLRCAAALKERLETLHKQLASLLGGPAAPQPQAAAPKNKKRKLSVAARKKLSEFQKARWAKIKKSSNPAAAPKKKKKFTMSATAKAAISRAAKARWAKIKAAQKKK